MPNRAPSTTTFRAAALLSIALAAGAGSLGAQQHAARTIDPGMTRAQVVERLGSPKGIRHTGAYTYLFYTNDCLERCGIDDVVTLHGDSVVDAIFRDAARRYSGASSSPNALTSRAARLPASTRRTGSAQGAIVASDAGAATAAPGSFVAGSAAAAPRRPGTATPARNARRPKSASARSHAASPTVPPLRLSAEDSAAAAPVTSAGVGAAAAAAGIDSARTGRHTTTGPVDARATVKNAGQPLFPSATPVHPSSGPGADSAARRPAGRVPYQGAKLAPADSAAAVRARPSPATPPKSDSTRPPTTL